MSDLSDNDLGAFVAGQILGMKHRYKSETGKTPYGVTVPLRFYLPLQTYLLGTVPDAVREGIIYSEYTFPPFIAVYGLQIVPSLSEREICLIPQNLDILTLIQTMAKKEKAENQRVSKDENLSIGTVLPFPDLVRE